jgi:putative hydrolase of the HAD superfamily
MLVRIPVKKLQLLQTLKTRYTVYLLSNTNEIHLNYINHNLLPEADRQPLDAFFHQTYYSHRMKKRKPDAEIFNQVLEEGGFLPEQTLFLDDSRSNVEGAGNVGIKTVHVVTPDFIFDYFS